MTLRSGPDGCNLEIMTLRTSTRADARLLLNATFGIWVGIYAFRTYVPTAVWNLSDALPLYMKGVIAIGVHLLGVAGCIMPITRRPRSAAYLGIAVAIGGILRQIFLGDDVVGSALSLMTWVVWLWWFAAFARVLARGRWEVTAAALAAAFSLQVGMQAAWHGLDLPMARGAGPIACAIIINALFVLTAHKSGADVEAPDEKGSLAIVALGAVLFLELTLFANLGRIGFISGVDVVTAAVVVQTGLIAGLLITHIAHRRVVIFVCGVVTVAATFSAPFVHGAGVIALVAGQAGIVPLIASASARPLRSTAAGFAIGMIVFFALLFLFYNHYEWPTLWVVAASVLVLCAVQPTAAVQPARLQPSCAGVAMFLAIMGMRAVVPKHDGTVTHDGLKILTYNIHQGFDAAGVPGMKGIANEIERVGADVVALQEVSRGWTFVGGADLIAYLRYRFPKYDIEFVPVNGQLWGIALMSRVPWADVRGRAFDAPSGNFRYGYASAVFGLGSGKIRIVGLHLTAGLDGDGLGGRVDQTNQLLRAFGADSTIVVVGDFNALPSDEPVQKMLASGFTDAGETVGLGARASWPAAAPEQRIDYVFVKGNVRIESGEVPQTKASDHLPLVMNIRARP